jgi:hypothetical protein
MRVEDIGVQVKEDEDADDAEDEDPPSCEEVEQCIKFLREQTGARDEQLKGRKRETKRLDVDKIKEYLEQKTSQSGFSYECCKKYCLRRNRSKDDPLLLDLAWGLREVLAYETTAGQNEIIFALLKDRWGCTEDRSGELKPGLCKGYAIPEVHNCARICS